jgi:ATP-dependent Lon protease
MLEVLDPEQNAQFFDHYLDLPFDLSRVFFVATANLLDDIPGPLRDRMEVVRIAGYTRFEKFEIARRYLLPQALAESGLAPGDLSVPDELLRAVIDGWTREAGVRDLKRHLGRMCRHRALEVASAPERAKRPRARKTARTDPPAVDARWLEAALGPRPFEDDEVRRTPEVGVACGLAWTPFGGEVLAIEATLVPGDGRLKLTGRLGEVMRESCDAALSYVKTIAEDLSIDPEAFAKNDVHLHVPAGATPKDGPSAGVAIATCLASLFTGKPVRADLAMTGEITLKGRVLPVGGIKEKVLAAHRAGIRHVLLPRGNSKDLP